MPLACWRLFLFPSAWWGIGWQNGRFLVCLYYLQPLSSAGIYYLWDSSDCQLPTYSLVATPLQLYCTITNVPDATCGWWIVKINNQCLCHTSSAHGVMEPGLELGLGGTCVLHKTLSNIDRTRTTPCISTESRSLIDLENEWSSSFKNHLEQYIYMCKCGDTHVRTKPVSRIGWHKGCNYFLIWN